MRVLQAAGARALDLPRDNGARALTQQLDAILAEVQHRTAALAAGIEACFFDAGDFGNDEWNQTEAQWMEAVNILRSLVQRCEDLQIPLANLDTARTELDGLYDSLTWSIADYADDPRFERFAARAEADYREGRWEPGGWDLEE